MLGLVFLFLAHQAAGQCGIHQTCAECNAFVGFNGRPCTWCASDKGVSGGCVDLRSSSCPDTTSAQAVCPPSLCENVATCEDCLKQASPAGGACGWCTTSDSLNIGCRSSSDSCVGSTSNRFWRQCTFPTTTPPVVTGPPLVVVWPTVLFPLCLGLGFLAGCIVFVRSRSLESRGQVRACYGLFFLSFVLYGAALFSVLLSLGLVRKLNGRKCCTCSCYWFWFCGCLEITAVLAGAVVAAVFDGIEGPSSRPFIGIFSLAIGMPTIYGGLIVVGIPRVILTDRLSRRKLKEDEQTVQQTPVVDERAPLIAQYPEAPMPYSK